MFDGHIQMKFLPANKCKDNEGIWCLWFMFDCIVFII